MAGSDHSKLIHKLRTKFDPTYDIGDIVANAFQEAAVDVVSAMGHHNDEYKGELTWRP